jgi:hypothetical protein
MPRKKYTALPAAMRMYLIAESYHRIGIKRKDCIA